MSTINFKDTYAAIWRGPERGMRAIRHIDPVRIHDLIGIEDQAERLRQNTQRFLEGRGANHALLWGSRGTGKSSLVKAILNEFCNGTLRLIEVDKYDLIQLPDIVDQLRDLPWHFVIYCDDLSFESGERDYKSLKHVMEGSVELPAANILIYATSNRRHIVPEYMHENSLAQIQEGELHPGEAIEEKIALADRFGLCLGFYPVTQETYFQMIDTLFCGGHYDKQRLHILAARFAIERGTRNGRVAKQFFLQFDPQQLLSVKPESQT